jgi:Ca-activated chloride channel family protein
MTNQGWRHLSFGAPDRLWWLLALAALGGAGWLLLRYRGSRREPYAAPALRVSAAPTGPGWRRWVASAVLGLAIVALTGAFARPQVPGKESTRRSVVVLAIDASGSMELNDISPDRFRAAKQRAKAFIQDLPANVDAGLVVFSTNARVVATPSPDHTAVSAAVDTLQVGGYTAMGDALALAVAAVRQDLGGTDSSAGRIVLLSDGASSRGRPLQDGIDAAVQAEIPVSTIALGTPDGRGQLYNGTTTSAPLDGSALEEVASETGGTAYTATASSELANVYRDIGSRLVTTPAPVDVSDVFAGVGLLLLLGSTVPALLWSGRLVAAP